MNKLILSLLLLISFSAYADMSVNNGRIQPSQSNTSGFKSDGRTYTSNSKQSTYLKSSNGARSNRPVNVTVQNQVSKRTVMSNVFRNAKSFLKSGGNSALGLLRNHPKARGFAIASLVCIKTGLCKYIKDTVEDFFDTEKSEGVYLIVLTNDVVGAPAKDNALTYKQFRQWCSKQTSRDASQSRTCNIVGTLPQEEHRRIDNLLTDACVGVDLSVPNSQKSLIANSRLSSGHCAVNKYVVSGNIGTFAILINDYVPLTEDRFIELGKDDADERPDDWVNASKDEDGKVPGMSKPIVIDIDVEVVISNPYTDPTDGKPKQTKWEFEKDNKGEVRVKETHEDRPDLEPNSPQAPKVKLDIDLEDDDKKEEQGKEQDNDKDNKPTEIEVELCEEGSDIIACQKLGEVDKDQFDELEVPKEEDNTAWSKEDLLPPTGVCPAPRSVNLHGYTISMEYTAICGVAERIRAVVLAVSMIAAGLMVVGSLRR